MRWTIGVALVLGLVGTAQAQQPQQGSRKNGIDPKAKPPSEEKKPAERYDPRASFAWRVGDGQRSFQSAKTEVLMTFTRRGKPLHVENKTGGWEKKTFEEIAELSPEGYVLKVRRTYERVKDFETGREDREPKTVLLDYSRPKLAFTKEEGTELHPLAARHLDHDTQVDRRDLIHILPKRETLVMGEEWEIPAAPVARLWLLDEEQLDGKESRCKGKLAAKRVVAGVEQIKWVLTFSLRMKKLWSNPVEFDPPASMDAQIEVWTAAHGEHPDEESTFRGTLIGTGKLPADAKVPEGTKLEMRITVKGEEKTSLVAAAR